VTISAGAGLQICAMVLTISAACAVLTISGPAGDAHMLLLRLVMTYIFVAAQSALVGGAETKHKWPKPSANYPLKLYVVKILQGDPAIFIGPIIPPLFGYGSQNATQRSRSGSASDECGFEANKLMEKRRGAHHDWRRTPPIPSANENNVR
jgi:hypothetical protein